MTSALSGANPQIPVNLFSVSTEPVKTETPIQNPKGPLAPEALKGKTVHEAISMQATADGTIKEGAAFNIEKLVGHFPKDGDGNILADHYTDGDKKFFKFDVAWEAKVNGKSVEFTQVIYTSIQIPADGSKLNDASKHAYEVAKSYELLQRNLKTGGSSSQIRAIQSCALISFEKKVTQLDLKNYKTSYIPKTSSGVELDVGLIGFTREPKIKPDKVSVVFKSRLYKMQAQNIILKEGTGDEKVDKAHLDQQLKEVRMQTQAALKSKKVKNSDAIEIKSLNNQLNNLLDEKDGELNVVEAKRKDLEASFDATPPVKDLQDAKIREGDLLKLLEKELKNPRLTAEHKEELKVEIDTSRAKIKEIEEKIISMKKTVLEDPIIEEGERFELEVEPKNESVVIDFEDSGSSDAELLESEEEVGGNPDLFGEGIKIGEYSPMPNDDQSNNKESI